MYNVRVWQPCTWTTVSDAGCRILSKPIALLTNGIVCLMRQGLTKHRVSLGLALAVTMAIFPIFFLPALVCLLLAAIMRLNQPIMQAVNYLAGPVQILLFLPFMRLGEWVFGLDPYTLDLGKLRQVLREDPSGILAQLRIPIGHAMLGWIVLAPILLALGYVVLYLVLHKMAARAPVRVCPEPERTGGHA